MPEPSHLTQTRSAYDLVAADYADQLRDALAGQPHDRALLGIFAELVRSAGGHPVADVGCGPGRITAHLDSLGLAVSGLDLSPEMVAVARRDHPHLSFRVGTVTALDLPDGALGGVVAWYSLIHLPPNQLPAAVAELARVLRPDGHLLTAFQVGDERLHLEQAYGHPLSLDAYRRRSEEMAALLSDAGLVVRTRVVREPEAPEKVPQAYLLARKPLGAD